MADGVLMNIDDINNNKLKALVSGGAPCMMRCLVRCLNRVPAYFASCVLLIVLGWLS